MRPSGSNSLGSVLAIATIGRLSPGHVAHIFTSTMVTYSYEGIFLMSDHVTGQAV